MATLDGELVPGLGGFGVFMHELFTNFPTFEFDRHLNTLSGNDMCLHVGGMPIFDELLHANFKRHACPFAHTRECTLAHIIFSQASSCSRSRRAFSRCVAKAINTKAARIATNNVDADLNVMDQVNDSATTLVGGIAPSRA